MQQDMTLIARYSGYVELSAGSLTRAFRQIVRFTFATLRELRGAYRSDVKVVIGRDARISGTMVSQAVSATLRGVRYKCTDIGLAPNSYGGDGR